MFAPNEFLPYLQSIVNPVQKNIQQGGHDRYISTLAELPLQVQTTRSSTSRVQEQQEERRERFAVLEGLRRYAPKQVLLVGKPGSGKTTSLWQLLYEDASLCLEEIEQGESEIPPIPILLELRNLNSSVLAAIQEKLGWWLNLDGQTLKALLRDRWLQILLDGLNELPNDQAWKQVDQFRGLCADLGVPLVIATRELGSGSIHGDIKKLEMLPLTEPQMQEFVHNRLPERGGELLRQIQGRLRELAETPLLLQMLCEVFAEKGEVPKNRGDLFRREFARRYEKFKPERFRNISEDSRRFAFDLLCYLAFAMVQGDPHTDPCKPTASWITIPKTQAAEILAKFLAGDRAPTLEDKAKAKEWLEDLVEWHLLQVASDCDRVEFHHQLFQEYYAGEWLEPQLAKLNDEELKYYLNYLKWTEPIAMAMALVESEMLAERVVVQALDTDLYLGARLAGEVQLSCQQATLNLLLQRSLTVSLTIWLLEQTRSPKALPFLLDVLKNGCSDTRWRAARALGNFAGKTVFTRLIEGLKDHNPAVRCKAAESLGKLGNKDAVPYLCQLFSDEDCLVRSFAVEILGKLDGSEPTHCLKIALEHEDSIVRGKAVEYLSQRISKEVIAHLNEQFSNGNTDTKRNVLSLLGRMKSADALPILIPALSEDDWIVRSEAVSQIGLLGIWLDKNLLEDASIALVNVLESDSNASVRSSAAIHLGIIGKQQAVPVLIKSLLQDCEVVRSSSANALGRLQDKSAISSLILALQDNKDDNVREAVIKALRSLNAVEALPAIRKLVASEVVGVRREAILTLGLIGDSKDKSCLYNILEAKDFSIRLCAAYSLSLLNNRKGVPVLEDALKTGNKDARKLALQGLKNFRGKVGLLSLLSRAFQDDEHSIRKECVDFLELFQDDLEVVKQLEIALNSLNEDVCRYAMDAAKTLGNPKTLLCLRQLVETIIVVERPLEAIAAIQSRCGFYNYEIAQISQTALSTGDATIEELLDTINMATQATYMRVNQMADQPKVQMIFNDSVENAVGNVEGNMIIGTAPSTREATTAIVNLLNTLRQKYPSASDAEILEILTKGFDAMPKKNPQNWQRWKDLFSLLFAGGTEALKIAKPEVGIPIEVLKRLYEIYDRNRKQLPGQ